MGLTVSQYGDLGPHEELYYTIEKLKKLAKTRTLDLDDTNYEKTLIECLCGRDVEGDKENYIPIYVENTNGRMLFSVCPKCNPLGQCCRCSGKGHILRTNQMGFEELIPCNGCIQTRMMTDQLNRATIPTRYLTSHLSSPVHESFSFLGFDAPTLENFENAREEVSNFCTLASSCLRSKSQRLYSKLYSTRKPILMDKPFLVLMGGVGTGKTYLASAALKHLITSSFTGVLIEDEQKPLDLYSVSGRFVDFPSLLLQIKDSFTQKSSELSVLTPLMETDVLVIDEFGKGRADNSWQLEKLDDLINARYNNNRITILTTNYLPSAQDYLKKNDHSVPPSPSQFEDFWSTDLSQRIGTRMFDRLLECSHFVSFVGLPSIRRKHAQRVQVSKPNQNESAFNKH